MTDADIEKLQQDITDKLKSESDLASINIVSLRRLHLSSEHEQALAWATPRTEGGRVGACIIVGMPTIDVPDPNVPGPQMDVVIPISAIEEPVTNQDAAIGTEETAEELIIRVLQHLHLWASGARGIGAYGEGRSIVPNTDIEGLVRYDAFIKGRLPSAGLGRVATPDITEDAGTVTITCATIGAAIYYTTDGSFPGSGNSAATLYSAPVAADTGTVILSAAYKAGMTGSDVAKDTIT